MGFGVQFFTVHICSMVKVRRSEKEEGVTCVYILWGGGELVDFYLNVFYVFALTLSNKPKHRPSEQRYACIALIFRALFYRIPSNLKTLITFTYRHYLYPCLTIRQNVVWKNFTLSLKVKSNDKPLVFNLSVSLLWRKGL